MRANGYKKKFESHGDKIEKQLIKIFGRGLKGGRQPSINHSANGITQYVDGNFLIYKDGAWHPFSEGDKI